MCLFQYKLFNCIWLCQGGTKWNRSGTGLSDCNCWSYDNLFQCSSVLGIIHVREVARSWRFFFMIKLHTHMIYIKPFSTGTAGTTYKSLDLHWNRPKKQVEQLEHVSNSLDLQQKNS